MSNAAPDAEQVGDQPELKRVMGPGLLLLFIVGDVLGTGVYALTGKVAGEVGGAAWAPFLVAFAIAMITAFSYLELVTKHPQAAGAALYTHKAFGIHFVTFMVAFTVMCSGITSASTAARAFGANFGIAFNVGLDEAGEAATPTTTGIIAVVFILLVAAINLRGVAESVKTNVVLTMIELSGLLLVIMIGLWAIAGGDADFSRVVIFESNAERGAFTSVTAATALAFFAMVGFEDSVNMAEETKDPVRTFPKMMITGLTITGIIYVLVSIVAVALVPLGELSESATPLVNVVETGAPNFPFDDLFPFISMFAVANSALINMMMASRLLYGMGKQQVLPAFLSRVLPERRTPWAAIIFTTVIALGLILYVGRLSSTAVETLGGTTSLLLLGVFTVVNVVVLVLRRENLEREHFRAPTILPVIGFLACAFLVTPLSGRDSEQYKVAGFLLAGGVVLWAITWFANRALRSKKTFIRDPNDLAG